MTIASLMGHLVQILSDYSNHEIIVETNNGEQKEIEGIDNHGESHTVIIVE